MDEGASCFLVAVIPANATVAVLGNNKHGMSASLMYWAVVSGSLANAVVSVWSVGLALK